MTVTIPNRRPKTFVDWQKFMMYENKCYVSIRPTMTMEQLFKQQAIIKSNLKKS